MYAITFFPEAMKYRFFSARIKLENNSKVVSATRGGYAENASLLIEGQIRVRVCAGHPAWETVQNCELAQRSYFENGAEVVGSTLISSPVKIPFRVLDQSSIGVGTACATSLAQGHTSARGAARTERPALRLVLAGQWNVLDCSCVAVQDLFRWKPVDLLAPVIVDVGITNIHRAQVCVLR
jgi:hypothetical protein